MSQGAVRPNETCLDSPRAATLARPPIRLEQAHAEGESTSRPPVGLTAEHADGSGGEQREREGACELG